MLSRKMNILLLGETGVGKSTFINMFGNYLSGRSLSDIASSSCNVLVPTKFSLQNEDFVEEIIEVGHSEHEIPGTGSSATRRPQMYGFNYPDRNLVLNVIDTPGVGDTRGLDHDEMNTEMLLAYIAEVESIDAFCILVKPDITRISVQFEVCIKQILDQLDISITKNIIFLITNGRMRNFTIGDTMLSLKTLLTKINRESGAIIPFNSSNTFCIDNEAFKYIVGKQQGIRFSQNEVMVYKNSFIQSTDGTKSMIQHIMTLQPAKMQGMATINESKRIIQRLITPLMNLTMSFENVKLKIQDYTNDLQAFKMDIERLKQNMFKIEYFTVVTENTVDSAQRDFNFCLDFGFGKINLKSLLKPFKFVFNILNNRQTSQNAVVREQKVLDTEVVALIKDRESAENAVRAKLYEMNEISSEFELEIQTILTAVANFSIFIDKLKLVTGQDYFEAIIKSLQEELQIDNNTILMDRIANYLQKYRCLKRRVGHVTAKDIMHCVNTLFALKHSGHVFREIIDKKVNFDKIIFH